MIPIILTRVLPLLIAGLFLTGCTSKSSTSSTSSPGGGGGPSITITLSAVDALHPSNGAMWNDYVKNDGASALDASDTACAGDEAAGYSGCLQGGQFRVLTVTGSADYTV